ncbi:MAG: helix-turn-helix domain-containing protein [Chloroflexota bacterium]
MMMPVAIDGQTFYRTAEVCHTVGISRSTFFRWLKQGEFTDAGNVDRRGWRLFTQSEVERLKAEVNQIKPNAARAGRTMP